MGTFDFLKTFKYHPLSLTYSSAFPLPPNTHQNPLLQNFHGPLPLITIQLSFPHNSPFHHPSHLTTNKSSSPPSIITASRPKHLNVTNLHFQLLKQLSKYPRCIYLFLRILCGHFTISVMVGNPLDLYHPLNVTTQ